ncbi:pilin [Photobacterium angustum]|uniref:Pilin n=1 Tax=Photobacterium angustum TaxID=661 RepID=A0A855SEC4_PHOAN|nr:pilin [Photobacterium angustum]KJF81193.1 pilin [Photobacterium damselae subsp. damselae]KJG39343.1 pilin [Photobacterium angustum]KJG44705.1 pilin [Photobacterium angustum]KJG48380.1 pilin [Photobacterium angustum]KJG52105.1 pilin [Photobacterium angustum]
MKKQQGFTLIELMIVVAVIGVLSAIAIPAYQNYVKKGALGSALSTATALKTPIETYIAENSNFPSTSDLSGAVPSFSLGSISLTTGTTAGDGTVVVTLTSTAASGANITLSKTAGLWTCANSLSSSISLNGC